MKLINPSVEIIPQGEGLLGVYKQIELAGRTCYKSEDKITEDSCKEFVQRMINNKHTAMLEHGTIYLKVPVDTWNTDKHEWEFMFPEELPWVDVDCDGEFYYITTNFRHIHERAVGIKLVNEFQCAPTNAHNRRVSAKFICDRGVSHELVRHRVFSFAQESTRYCNYSKGKFGGELTFITPSWWEGANESTKNLFLDSLSTAEDCYMEMLDNGCTPQQSRQILPNALKTEVIMTGFVSDWEHFFDLRCAKSAHPDMQFLANQLKKQFIQNKYL